MANPKIKIWGAFAAAFSIPMLAMAAIETTDNTVYRKPPNWCNTDRLGNLTGRDIPYGGFTAGVCGVSNDTLRVTDRLMGVVASVWDGYDERSLIPYGYHPGDYDHYWSVGSYTNNTTRLLDVINVGGCYKVRKTTGEVDPTRMFESPIEEALASDGHWGLAARYGSRYLDELCGDALPPISTNWQQVLPFRPADADAWRFVYPTYEALQFDTHFYPTNEVPYSSYDRDHLYGWMARQYWFEDIVNDKTNDYWSAVYSLYDALYDLPLTNVLEDVLKIDPGWNYPAAVTSDYWIASGPLGTLRLDLVSVDPLDPDYDDNITSWYGRNPSVPYGFSLVYVGEDDPTWYIRYWTYASGWDDALPGNRDLDSLSSHGWTFTRHRPCSADDFANWRNMTRRFDYKRLGIICQLERHMEHTYDARQREDEPLPLIGLSSTHRKAWTAVPTNLAFSVVNDTVTGGFSAELLSDIYSRDVTWTLVTNDFAIATNSYGNCYPTARAPRSSLSGLIHSDGCYVPLYVTIPQLRDAISRALTSEPSTPPFLVEIVPEYFPAGAPYARAQLMWGIVAINHVYSPTVRVAEWDFDDGVYYAAASAGDPLLREYWQRASVCYTPRDTGTNVAANLYWDSPEWPLRSIWNGGWVKAVEVPTLEALIASSNCPPQYAGSTSSSPMPWSELDETNATYRAFRLAPFARCETRSNLERERVRSIDLLNLEVADKFQELCGERPESYISTYGHLDGDGEAALQRTLRPLQGQASLGIVYGEGSTYYVEADDALEISRVYNVRYDPTSGGEITNTVPYDPGRGYMAAYMQFDFEYATNALSGPSPAVRVDSHQNQMTKKIWKFRNLGDPDNN